MSPRLLLLAAVLLTSCSFRSSLFPPAVVPRFPNASDWPDAGAAVTDEQAVLTYRIAEVDDQPVLAAVVTHRRRIKVLDAKGLDAARVELDVDGYSRITQVDARSVSPDGDVVWMSQGAIVAGSRLPGLSPKAAVQRLRFTVPEAQVGGLIEYRYERVYADVAFVPPWVFGAPLPVLRSELAVVAPPGVTIDYRQGQGSRLVEETPLQRTLDDGSERLVFVRQNLPAWYPEPQMPHLGHVAPWVVVVVTDYTLGGQRHTMRTWDDVGARMKTLLSAVGGEVHEGSPTEIYSAVRDQLKPLPVDGLGVLAPIPAAKLRKGALACTRDATAVLLKALSGSDAKAYPAFLSSPMGPPVIDGLPGMYPFVRAVVAVDVAAQVAADPSCREDPVSRGLLCSVPADSYAFVDPLCGGCRYGELATEYTGGRALVLLPEGARWVRVPEDPPERNRSMTQYKLRLDVDGSVSGAMSADLTGAAARRARDAVRAMAAGESQEDVLGEVLTGKRSSPRLEEASLVALDTADEPFGVRAKVEGRLEEVAYERYVLRVVDLVGAILPGRWRRVRRFPTVLDAPAWVETAATLALPAGYNVDPRAMVKFVEPFGEYAAGFERSGRTLFFSRRLVLHRQVISVDDWPGFRRFLDRIEEYERAGMSVWLQQGLP